MIASESGISSSFERNSAVENRSADDKNRSV